LDLYSSLTIPGCYPFTDKDPFVLESCPHVYFVGNQDKYETRLIDGINLQKYMFFPTKYLPETLFDPRAT